MRARSRMPRPSSWKLRKTFLRKKSLGSASVLKRYQPSRRALGVRVVEPVEEVWRPGHLVLGGADAEPRIALEDAGEDQVAQRDARRTDSRERRRWWTSRSFSVRWVSLSPHSARS